MGFFFFMGWINGRSGGKLKENEDGESAFNLKH